MNICIIFFKKILISQFIFFVVNFTIFNKYQKKSNLLNIKILDYTQNRIFDLILSISKFEHIGFDEKI